jgi:hypothetical protein
MGSVQTRELRLASNFLSERRPLTSVGRENGSESLVSPLFLTSTASVCAFREYVFAALAILPRRVLGLWSKASADTPVRYFPYRPRLLRNHTMEAATGLTTDPRLKRAGLIRQALLTDAEILFVEAEAEPGFNGCSGLVALLTVLRLCHLRRSSVSPLNLYSLLNRSLRIS